MTTAESNRIIAEFMGAKMPCYSKDRKGKITQCDLVYNGVTVSYIDHSSFFRYDSGFKFHESWDWIMPVVEKIGSMPFNESNNRYTDLNVFEVNIDEVYKAVIQFIQWYNDNQINNR